ncbi:tetraacyldisaccharide 4'-kinase [candidate division NPL-UPA2 bacterium Unc8]|uniref:Tetraacyldisaccharide 4'-kinase n=1 Tax=candidate division NPL-UPA2 bacterium Unc8 TaxID=1980939 RepID=A0A399FYY7_UNCN2|nr:Tetraacyldisaccharide 4'-kinase [Bacillota bacterium]MBT9146564.1 Tetraacyldisaccharide 4'-kinase [Bacillota bacterium]RII00580.1 MAG: tetraacyldisaccharide 4'-kinase [candidate division NPL-UPA2 bacterium Unc8]
MIISNIKNGWLKQLEGLSNKTGISGYFLNIILTVLSQLYRVVIFFIALFYRRDILRRRKLPCYVISVGNITAGGTGKTPAVAMIAGLLKERGRKVAILSRGYKRIHSRWSIVHSKIGVVSDGAKTLMDVKESGDEPYLLSRKLPGIAVLVGGDRRLTGSYAITNFRTDTIVLDDGFQYLRLHRDLDIVIIDSAAPFGNGRLLPRGRLREPLRSLRRGKIFLLTRVDQADNIDNLIKRLGEINPHAKIVQTIHFPEHLIDIRTGSREEIAVLSGKKILALSSIGSPESFEKTLIGLGAVLVKKLRFPDHHWYVENELREIKKKAIEKRAEFIVTTEKDAVRIALTEEEPSIDFFCMVIKLKIIKGEKLLEEQILHQ